MATTNKLLNDFAFCDLLLSRKSVVVLTTKVQFNSSRVESSRVESSRVDAMRCDAMRCEVGVPVECNDI
jgi:hypothetical protein